MAPKPKGNPGSTVSGMERGQKKTGAIFPGSASLADDIASLRMLMRIAGIRSAEIDTILRVGDSLAALLDGTNTVGRRVDAPVIVLTLGGATYNISLAVRRTK